MCCSINWIGSFYILECARSNYHAKILLMAGIDVNYFPNDLVYLCPVVEPFVIIQFAVCWPLALDRLR